MKMPKLFKNVIIALVIICGLSVSLLSRNIIISSHKKTVPTSNCSNNIKATNSNNLDTKEYNWYFKHVKNWCSSCRAT